jgi:putative effector of murein hydrolase
MAMGAAAHGIGTAQMGDEPDAQPFAAIAMSLVGAASVVAAATPASRALLLRAAGV